MKQEQDARVDVGQPQACQPTGSTAASLDVVSGYRWRQWVEFCLIDDPPRPTAETTDAELQMRVAERWDALEDEVRTLRAGHDRRGEKIRQLQVRLARRKRRCKRYKATLDTIVRDGGALAAGLDDVRHRRVVPLMPEPRQPLILTGDGHRNWRSDAVDPHAPRTVDGSTRDVKSDQRKR